MEITKDQINKNLNPTKSYLEKQSINSKEKFEWVKGTSTYNGSMELSISNQVTDTRQVAKFLSWLHPASSSV